MISYYIGRAFGKVGDFFYQIHLDDIGYVFNRIENWFFVRGWNRWL